MVLEKERYLLVRNNQRLKGESVFCFSACWLIVTSTAKRNCMQLLVATWAIPCIFDSGNPVCITGNLVVEYAACVQQTDLVEAVTNKR